MMCGRIFLDKLKKVGDEHLGEDEHVAKIWLDRLKGVRREGRNEKSVTFRNVVFLIADCHLQYSLVYKHDLHCRVDMNDTLDVNVSLG